MIARRAVDRPAAVVAAGPLDLAGVDAHPHGEPERAEVALGGHGGVRRPTRRTSKAAAMPSPSVANTSPPAASTAARRTSKCRSTRSAIAGDCSHCRVEPSMSVNRNVTVAAGRSSVRRGAWRSCAPASRPSSSANRIGPSARRIFL